MRIATWNVNSVRARMERLLPWLEEKRPDVVCLQETKCTDDLFPGLPIQDLGYEIAVHGQRTYNGVAILSLGSMEDVVRGLPGDDEARLIAATIDDVMVLNLYVVNGRSVGSEHYNHKLEWMGRLSQFVRERYPMSEKVVLCGDFNCTFDDRDVHDPEAWREHILCSTPEREALQELMSVGLHDPLRKFTDEGGNYTWWDFRTFAFRKDKGLRIDHFLLSDPALAACTGVEVDRAARKGPKPSDHAPVIATFE
ncbi:MAG: exodeoxyribonuclease III [Planctomycetota bacterium]|nr:exodeoxyribonuclease III [Planctomycetota bacterium]